MEDMEVLEVQIKDLENAYTNIIEAMNNIKDIDGLDEEYSNLDIMAQKIDERKSDLETELENLEEEAYCKENEEQWQTERLHQEYEYLSSRF